MSKNSSKNITCNCILISKSGNLKEIHVAESEMNRAKYSALCKTPPTYEKTFKRHTAWTVKKYGIVVELWARANGRAGQENKYEFPPPVDETLFFGDCILVSTREPLTCAVWKKAYEHLFGGFDDLEKLALADDAELDELEHVPNKKKTKHGYLKDGFIIDDSSRAKHVRSSSSSLKMTMGADALISDDGGIDCNEKCDKTIANIVRNHKSNNVVGDDSHDDDQAEADDDADEGNETGDDDDDDDDDDDLGDEDDEDDDEDEDDQDDEDDEDDEEHDDNEDDGGDDSNDAGVGIKVKPKYEHHHANSCSSEVAPESKSITNVMHYQSQSAAIVSNKKRAAAGSGVRANSGRKRGVSAMSEIIKGENASTATATTTAGDKTSKSTNLDSELEEESYV